MSSSGVWISWRARRQTTGSRSRKSRDGASRGSCRRFYGFTRTGYAIESVQPSASVIFTRIVTSASSCGTPCRRPPDVRCKPDGSEPSVIVNEYGGVPPTISIWKFTCSPRVISGMASVTFVSVEQSGIAAAAMKNRASARKAVFLMRQSICIAIGRDATPDFGRIDQVERKRNPPDEVICDAEHKRAHWPGAADQHLRQSDRANHLARQSDCRDQSA